MEFWILDFGLGNRRVDAVGLPIMVGDVAPLFPRSPKRFADYGHFNDASHQKFRGLFRTWSSAVKKRSQIWAGQIRWTAHV